MVQDAERWFGAAGLWCTERKGLGVQEGGCKTEGLQPAEQGDLMRWCRAVVSCEEVVANGGRRCVVELKSVC